MRDLDKNPYSEAEQRVAQFFFDRGLGGGDDPIGAILASHQALADDRNELRRWKLDQEVNWPMEIDRRNRELAAMTEERDRLLVQLHAIDRAVHRMDRISDEAHATGRTKAGNDISGL